MRAWIAGIVVVGALAAGCGDDGDSPEADAGAPGTSESTGSDGSDTSGDGGDAVTLPRFCELLSAEKITEAVGAPVTLTTGPFDACEFDQEDPRALSGSLGATDLGAGAGGYESYQSGTKGSLGSPVRHEFSGLGEGAYVDLGTVGGGESLQVAGGVLDGQVIYTVNLSQGSGMSEDELVAISERLLELLVAAA